MGAPFGLILKVFSQNKHVRIEVHDNGYGMPQKILEGIFTTPATTKGSSEGTGLGLYRVRQMASNQRFLTIFPLSLPRFLLN
ncbi:MAG: hypothetical protein HQL23_08925 [Candidatus Omnitrophica bacterium]|nr:hypothetical protein [Candidatus Omnitrophota bacterium]